MSHVKSLSIILWALVGGLSLTTDVKGQHEHSKPKPEIIDVVPTAHGAKTTLQSAIDAAPEHAVIRIAPGTYEGPLHITKPVTLEGAGWRQTKLTNQWHDLRQLVDGQAPISPNARQRFDELMRKLKNSDGKEHHTAMTELWKEFGGKATVSVSHTRDVFLKGLTISMRGTVRAGGGMMAPMFLVDSAGVRVEDCAIAGSPVGGFHVEGTSDLKLHKCLIAGIRWSGIRVNPPKKPIADSDSEADTRLVRVRVTECDIRNCGYSGIALRGPAEAEVKRCRISKMAFHGIRFDDCSPKISGNVLFDIDRGGLYLGGKTAAIIRDNLFLGCCLWHHGEADYQHLDLIEHNTFVYPGRDGDDSNRGYGSGKAALSIQDKSDPTVRKNLISGSDHGVILSGPDKSLTKVENNLFDTRLAALVYWEGADEDGKFVPVDLPAGNQVMAIQFADTAADDYSLAHDQPLNNRDVGTRGYAEIKSPWPELPQERDLMRQLAEAESAGR